MTAIIKCQKEIVKGSDILGRFENSIQIRAPPEKVWEMLALDRVLEWEEGWKGTLKSVEYTSEVRTPKDKLRVGATAHGTSKKKGGFDFEITESLENEKMAYRFLYGKMAHVLVTYILEPVEEGTKFTYVIDYELLSILWKIFGKLLTVGATREYERSLKNFKSILEK
ncbi:MAG: SRPBCC family protein [archaeon]|nr:SRPBCC family protein [archaeon]MCP8321300.1 SRPBCC family protein [archaeon]